jgi:hypothetical protein
MKKSSIMNKVFFASFTTSVLFLLASCGSSSSTQSKSRTKSENATESSIQLNTSAYVGKWRMEAQYPDSVIGSGGQVSGVTATIQKGQNIAAGYPGQVACDLIVSNSQHDYNALELPGGDGKTFNPCELIVAVLKVFPYEGKTESIKENPRGGKITQHFDNDGNLKGYVFEGPEAGKLSLSVDK